MFVVIVTSVSLMFCYSVTEDGLNVPRLIINQLKWLDRIIDCKVLYWIL